MRCKVTNCLHMTRVTTSGRSSSWNMQICRCCAYNLHWINTEEQLFLKFKRAPALKCRTPLGRNWHLESYDFKRALEITLKKQPNQTMLELNHNISKILNKEPYNKPTMYWRLSQARRNKIIIKSNKTFELVKPEGLKILA